MALSEACYAPLLMRHTFFRALAEVDSEAMQEICNGAVHQVALSRGDILFAEALDSRLMFFVLRGKLWYTLHKRQFTNGSTLESDDGPMAPYVPERKTLNEGEWCCEASLWADWTHLGTLRTESMSEVLTINAQHFAEITLARRKVRQSAARYGRAYVERLNEHSKLGKVTDVPPLDAFDDLVQPAFEAHHRRRLDTLQKCNQMSCSKMLHTRTGVDHLKSTNSHQQHDLSPMPQVQMQIQVNDATEDMPVGSI